MAIRAVEQSESGKAYLCEYPYQGARWGFEIRALDRADAEARLKAIGWGVVLGESQGRLPGWLPVWIVRLVCWWKNR